MNNERKFSGLEKTFLGIIGFILIFSIGFYVFQLHQNPLAQVPADFSAFGSYIGGVVSPLIALISIILLYRTYKTQLDITKYQEEQLDVQQFENTFFALLNSQRTILMSCKGVFYEKTSLRKYSKTLSDYQYIDRIAEELKIQMLNFEYESELLKDENINLIRTLINDYYLEVFLKHIPQLSHYFRHLYHILKYVDESRISDKKKYIDLIQAQMSNNELYISFYNGISIYGREKMLPLMDRYSFLENLKVEDTTVKRHCELFYNNTNMKDYSKEKGNIIFIGGIHGVGKGYLANELLKMYSFHHLSSSEVIKWEGEDKQVSDVNQNQDILVQNLKKIVAPDKIYLLDGHFCLLKKDNSIENIPFNTFQEINPVLIILLVGDINIIKGRLKERDNNDYPLELLDNLQKKEMERAKEISNKLGVQLV